MLPALVILLCCLIRVADAPDLDSITRVFKDLNKGSTTTIQELLPPCIYSIDKRARWANLGIGFSSLNIVSRPDGRSITTPIVSEEDQPDFIWQCSPLWLVCFGLLTIAAQHESLSPSESGAKDGASDSVTEDEEAESSDEQHDDDTQEEADDDDEEDAEDAYEDAYDRFEVPDHADDDIDTPLPPPIAVTSNASSGATIGDRDYSNELQLFQTSDEDTHGRNHQSEVQFYRHIEQENDGHDHRFESESSRTIEETDDGHNLLHEQPPFEIGLDDSCELQSLEDIEIRRDDSCELQSSEDIEEESYDYDEHDQDSISDRMSWALQLYEEAQNEALSHVYKILYEGWDEEERALAIHYLQLRGDAWKVYRSLQASMREESAVV